MHSMPKTPRFRELRKNAQLLFDELLAGASAEEVQPVLGALSAVESNAVLCALCAIHPEVKTVCQAPAEQIAELLKKNCPFHQGKPTCTFPPYANLIALG